MRRFCLSIWFSCCLGLTLSIGQIAAETPPNIVFLFIDDMGVGDLGCYGSKKIETPRIDQLAREGIRFTQFYVASPICSPSRVGVTTGQFPSRHGVLGHFASRKQNRQRQMPDYLNPHVPTLARSLKQQKYATAHFGKWHMGGGRDVDDAPHPKAYGFDESLVSFEGLGDRILPEGSGLAKQSEQLAQGEIRWVPKHTQTGIYVDRALNFVSRNQQGPFYLQLWFNDVHDPFQPKEELLKKYASASDNPYFQKYLAVIDELDRQIGRLLDHLDKLGLRDNTLVVLSSDNGPTAWPRYYKEKLDPPGSTNGLRGRKWSLYEGGIREPLIARWPGKIPADAVNTKSVIGAVDLFPTFCAIAGATVRADLDGVDFSPALFGKDFTRTQPLFWDYGRNERFLQPGLKHDQSPNLAIREGNWKLLMNADGSRVELYDLSKSDKEAENVAADHPDVTERLKQQLLNWRAALPSFARDSE